MKFSDDLLKTVGAILEAKPRVSFDGDKATVHSKNGTAMKSFNKSDLGTSYRKHADNFLSQNYKKLNAESVIVEELEEAKQLELPGMEKKKPQQLELPLGDKKKDKKDMKESEDQLDELSKNTLGTYIKKASKDASEKSSDAVHQYHSDTDDEKAFDTMDKAGKRLKGVRKATDKLVKKEEVEDVNASNAAKATMHDCANHVRHEEYGFGQTISTMHTLEEDEDGNGYVTHYDVMFKGEDGPFIKEDVSVEELEIISEMHHGHPKGKKKKMKEEVEAIDEKKGHKKDKGDMDGDGKDEPDDEEYMDNKDKAIKMAMSKKKSESPIKKVEEEIISEEAYEIADLILEYFPKEKIGQSKNYHIKSIDPEQGAYSLKHKKTGKKTTINVTDNHPFSRTRHVNRDLQKNSPEVPGSDRHAVARHINKHIQHTGMDGSDPKKDKAGTGDVRRSLQKDGDSRKSMKESPTYVPGFIGADGKATSKPTKKDYDSNKEYQSMKKKLGDRIPGPPPVKKINKEHLDSISAALQEISKKTLHNYVKKSREDSNERTNDLHFTYHHTDGNHGDTADRFGGMHASGHNKLDSRNDGIQRAANRMADKKYGKSKPGKKTKLSKPLRVHPDDKPSIRYESQEVQEISKGVLNRYQRIRRNDHDILGSRAAYHHQRAMDHGQGNYYVGNEKGKDKADAHKEIAHYGRMSKDQAKKTFKKVQKHRGKESGYEDQRHTMSKGIDRAFNRLASDKYGKSKPGKPNKLASDVKKESYSGEPEHVVKQAKKDAEETRSKRLKGMFKGNKK